MSKKSIRENIKHVHTKKVYLFFILVIIALFTIGVTYAKYKSTRSGSLNGKVLKWHFELIDGIQETEEIDFPITRTDENENVPEGRIAPGTAGEIPIVIDTTVCEVNTKCETQITITNCPSNIVFYREDETDYYGLDIVRSGTGSKNDPKITTIGLVSYIDNQDHGEIENKIYWKWNYETTGYIDGLDWEYADVDQMNSIDSLDGNVDEIFFNITITGSQEEFDADGVPYHAYAMLEGNTLRFRNYDYTEEEQDGNLYFGDVYDIPLSMNNDRPWTDYSSSIYTVKFDNLIKPRRTDGWFGDLRKLESIENIENLDTSKVTTMVGMFIQCTEIETLDLSTFDTSNVTDMSFMFSQCRNLKTLNLSSFDTSKVTSMDAMFQQCNSLEELDLSNFDVENVKYMRSMFYSCSGLENLDLSNFNTKSVISMAYMFFYCNNMKTLDISNFNTSNVSDMEGMFYLCYYLETIYVKEFDTSKVVESSGMFEMCASLVGENGTEVNRLHLDHEYARVDNPPDEPGYFTAKN